MTTSTKPTEMRERGNTEGRPTLPQVRRRSKYIPIPSESISKSPTRRKYQAHAYLLRSMVRYVRESSISNGRFTKSFISVEILPNPCNFGEFFLILATVLYNEAARLQRPIAEIMHQVGMIYNNDAWADVLISNKEYRERNNKHIRIWWSKSIGTGRSPGRLGRESAFITSR